MNQYFLPNLKRKRKRKKEWEREGWGGREIEIDQIHRNIIRLNHWKIPTIYGGCCTFKSEENWKDINSSWSSGTSLCRKESIIWSASREIILSL